MAVVFVGADASTVGHHVGDVVLFVDPVDEVGERTCTKGVSLSW